LCASVWSNKIVS